MKESRDTYNTKFQSESRERLAHLADIRRSLVTSSISFTMSLQHLGKGRFSRLLPTGYLMTVIKELFEWSRTIQRLIVPH